MLQMTFTPRSVVEKIFENSDYKQPKTPYFSIFDPVTFFVRWSQKEHWQKAEDALAGYFRWSQTPDGYPIENWEMLYLTSTKRAIELARSGDLSAIQSRLRVRDLPLSQEEQDLLADRAEGKLKFKRGRKKKNPPRAYLTVFLWFEIVEGVKKRDAKIAEIEECFGVSISHVNAMLRKIYGTSEEAEIRDAVERLSASEFWKAEMARFMKDLFSK